MYTIALIPARGGSKRIPQKNIKFLGDKPLVVWSIETALALKLPCYVSTDSQLIADISRQAGAQVIHRPPELATDEAGDAGVIAHALGQVEADLLVYLRPTSPLRKVTVVSEAIQFMEEHSQFPLLRSLHKSSESFAKGATKNSFGVWQAVRWHGKYYTNKPNQECPETGIYNGYVDIFRSPETKYSWDERIMHSFETEMIFELDEPWQWKAMEIYLSMEGRNVVESERVSNDTVRNGRHGSVLKTI